MIRTMTRDAQQTAPRGALIKKPVRWFYRWLLPLLWAAICRLNFDHPGDEYGMWGVASMAAAWIIPFGGTSGDIKEILPRALFAGALTMFVVGWIMDRVRVPRRWWFITWLPLAAALCVWSLSQYPSYARAMSKNGSLHTYVYSSLNFAMYPSVLLLLVATPFFRLGYTRTRAGHCVKCDYDLTGNTSGVCPECGTEIQ